jgi:hypothetical protein
MLLTEPPTINRNINGRNKKCISFNSRKGVAFYNENSDWPKTYIIANRKTSANITVIDSLMEDNLTVITLKCKKNFNQFEKLMIASVQMN